MIMRASIRYRVYLLIVMLCGVTAVRAQESESVFNFLSLNSSAHANALSGRNISLIEDDASLTLQNPALLSSVSNNSINFNFMTYLKGSKLGSMAYARTAGERGAWGVAAQFVGYGKMKETTASGEMLGDTKALDVLMQGMYSYCFNDRWAGGASGKFIYSTLGGGYNSVGLAVDLGLNYYYEEKDFSMSAVAANLGGQVKAYGNKHERIPFNLMFGLSKGLGHAPIRISVTMIDLTRWGSKYYYNPSGAKTKAGAILLNHFDLGIDITPANKFYIAAGYNFRRGYEMKTAGKSHWAGLTAGAGLSLKDFKAGIAIAKYHVSAPSLTFSLGYSF